MNIEQLIEKLSKLDPTLKVVLASSPYQHKHYTLGYIISDNRKHHDEEVFPAVLKEEDLEHWGYDSVEEWEANEGDLCVVLIPEK